MAVLKLSQITASGVDLAATDQLVGVHGGNTDLLYTGQQVADLIAALGYFYSTTTIVTEATTARILAAADNGKTILCTNAAAVTITVPTGLGAAFSATIIQMGAGQVGFATSGGAVINSLAAATHIVGRYAGATLLATAADVLLLSGGLS